ncbi:U4/U6 small nuclear ribonucleoprotein Prp31, partial [Kipferlia bialata]|eukprot:g9105.t1
MSLLEDLEASEDESLSEQEVTMKVESMGADTQMGGEPVKQTLKQSLKEAAKLEEEIVSNHHRLREAYAPRFPEIGVIPLSARDMATVVLASRNDPRAADLSPITDKRLAATLSMAFSTQPGRFLSNTELKTCMDLASGIATRSERIEVLVAQLTEDIQAQAPNLCALLSPAVAARCVAEAGGLKEVSRMPGCDLTNLGRKKRTIATGQALDYKHFGFLLDAPFVVEAPNE